MLAQIPYIKPRLGASGLLEFDYEGPREHLAEFRAAVPVVSAAVVARARGLSAEEYAKSPCPLPELVAYWLIDNGAATPAEIDAWTAEIIAKHGRRRRMASEPPSPSKH